MPTSGPKTINTTAMASTVISLFAIDENVKGIPTALLPSLLTATLGASASALGRSRGSATPWPTSPASVAALSSMSPSGGGPGSYLLRQASGLGPA